jgi:hypothetical protein
MGISVFPAAGGGVPRTIDFTSSGTWVAPAGVYSAEVMVVGAGGGAGGVYCNLVTYAVGSGGGGGGSVKKATIPITPGSTYTITVGAKGTGGTNAAGTNGGYSEIVLSGTTLIRSYGGRGSSGIDTNPAVVNSAVVAGIGYGATTTATTTDPSACTGGGGGAFYANQGGLSDTTYLKSSPVVSQEGSYGKVTSSSFNLALNIVGVLGIDGYGSGGNGANWNDTGPAATYDPPYGAGIGAVVSNTTGAANGGNALANTGGGGGGACVVLTATTGSTGGDGSDGLVRITYNG